ALADLKINDPTDATACASTVASPDALDAAFNTWLTGFSVSGGCAPTGSYGTPTAPVLCDGGTTTVTYNYSDLCETGSVTASFTVTAPADLTINEPTDVTASACTYANQAALDAAFNTWLTGFSVSGGCAPTGSYGTPTAPVLCDGGTTTVTYNYSDLCETGSVTASFTVTAPADLTINEPTYVTASACTYANQAALDAAFNTWLTG